MRLYGILPLVDSLAVRLLKNAPFSVTSINKRWHLPESVSIPTYRQKPNVQNQQETPFGAEDSTHYEDANSDHLKEIRALQ
jgi:hypothetical protein